MKSAFFEKLITRLDRVELSEIQLILSRLVNERRFYRTVFEALHEGVIILTPQGEVDFVNHFACQFFGFDKDKVVGENLSNLIRGLDWESLASPQSVLSRDLEIFYPENRYLNFYVAPIRDVEKDSELFGYVMLIRDVTAQRAENEETIESERLNALTLLAAGVAHEIGNPLNSIDIHLQLMARKLKKLPTSAQDSLSENLSVARQEIERLNVILKQFLQAVRPTTPQREKQDIHLVLHETLKLLEPELAARNISVELDLSDSLPLISMDSVQFQQVFYNLLRNASQAMKRADSKITVRTRSGDFSMRIVIEDNGSGISPENMGALFEPYRTTKSSGSGLGLLIVRRIIREHGGEIAIESEMEQGTRVIIDLPYSERTVRLLGDAQSVIDTTPF